MFYLKTGEDRKALDSFRAIIKSGAVSFKQGLYRLEALVLSAEYYLKAQNTKELANVLSRIDSDFRNSPILKQNHFIERISNLKEFSKPGITKNGKITTVNSERGFVIIEDTATHDTFLGHKFKFIPPIENLSITLKGKAVTFEPADTKDSDRDKKQAKSIKITTANSGSCCTTPSKSSI